MLLAITLVFSAVLGISPSPVASSPNVTHTQMFDFAPGGSLRIHIRVGDMRIVRGADPQHIVLRYTATTHGNREDAADRVKTRFEVKGSQGEIDLRAPNGVDLEVEVEVPSPLELTVRMGVGDLRVDGVEGNLDVEDHVGDIAIKSGSEKEYEVIDASTRIGDVDGLPGSVHGWLGKSGKVEGTGKYRLHAHVGVGDVHLSFNGTLAHTAS